MNARSIIAALVFLTCISAFAQVQTPAERQAAKEQLIQQVCRGPQITSGPEVNEVHQIMLKLAPILDQDKQHRVYIAVANNNEINAWATNFNMTDSLICVPVAMVHFMGNAEGELSFIIAHEIGHTVDDVCKTQEGRVAVATSRSSLGAIFATNKTNQQRGCEARADEIGFRIFTASGQNPYDAAGAFGRIEMYMGDTSTGMLARLNALGSDHPMTPDRIKNMRTLLINYEKEHQLTATR